MPARPRKPKDKAKVEVGVQIVERWILARLRDMEFFSVGELNAYISKLLKQLNDTPFQKLPGSRRSKFERVGKPALRPLPPHSYRHKEIRGARGGPRRYEHRGDLLQREAHSAAQAHGQREIRN